jgi:hypothetical protein
MSDAIRAASRPKPPDPVDEGTHLDNIASVLHYAGIPIIAIDRLHPGWPSYGNRYVMAFPRIDEAMRAARDAGLCKGLGYCNHLIECAYCRRWSITRRLVFCSRKCTLKARADEARAQRMRTAAHGGAVGRLDAARRQAT